MGGVVLVLSNDLGGVGMAVAVQALRDGRPALDAVEEGIRRVEADAGVRHVGLGGDPNLLGQMECDAAIMDGSNRMVGAVGALKGYLHAISVARAVMERLPHVMLVGEGAARFAQEIGQEPTAMLTDAARAAYDAWLAKEVPPEARSSWPAGALAPYAWAAARRLEARDTVIFLAIDAEDNVAAGTSTSGWSYKYPGRLGDSPIVGAGLYAREGGGACACTHTGEMTIRACTAVSVVSAIRRGNPVRQACVEAAADIRGLAGGHVGAVVIHAVDPAGTPCVVCATAMGEIPAYWFWEEGLAGVERRSAESVA
jgi:beta-aspartyl-peptidase (threonine type)